MTFNQELGDERGVLAILIGFAGIDVARGRWEDAASLFGAAETFLGARSIRLVYMDRAERDRTLAVLREHLSSRSAGQGLKKGASWTLEQTIEFALKSAQ